ncbi:hypothetical protein ACTVPT_22245 [Serratia bockelmannii]|nr:MULTISPECIES: hypothetical protein [Enterobacterales]MCX2945906.1 hypothetical protein [Rahnella perminowiae]MEB8265759.1 hypothetical protein [Klebsiella grimontii]
MALPGSVLHTGANNVEINVPLDKKVRVF